MLRKIPNILTIGRILIVPFFVLAFYLPGFYGDLTALILFVVASFTDFLDGMLARLLGEESKLGELLDPIADKIIVATALILLVMDGTIRHYEVIAAIIILTREILISGFLHGHYPLSPPQRPHRESHCAPLQFWSSDCQIFPKRCEWRPWLRRDLLLSRKPPCDASWRMCHPSHCPLSQWPHRAALYIFPPPQRAWKTAKT